MHNTIENEYSGHVSISFDIFFSSYLSSNTEYFHFKHKLGRNKDKSFTFLFESDNQKEGLYMLLFEMYNKRIEVNI